MKLLQKTSLIYLILSAIILLAAGIFIYTFITSVIEEEIEEKLIVNKERIARQLERSEEILQLPPVIEVKELSPPQTERLRIHDTMVYDPIEEEAELFKEVTSIEEINGKIYKITVRQVILEPHDYLETIGVALAGVFGLLLLGLFLMNRNISKVAWKPFYQNLESLRQYSLESNEPIKLKNSSITEFKELNIVIEKLTEKIRADYLSLKEFSENASHEMQTPLAIIQAKLEEALQEPELSERLAHHIQLTLAAAQRLSRLNQTLLLITKIENRQFTEKQQVNVAEIIEQILRQFEESIELKEISIRKSINGDNLIRTNISILEILISNLVSNAIKHNYKEGEIRIDLNDNILTISNTAPPGNFDTAKMFDRFTKGDASSSSLGLGLSIVKKICDINGWRISYQKQDDLHSIKINF